MKRTVLGTFGHAFAELADGQGHDFARYRGDPLGFFRAALDFTPWAAQEDVARACAPPDAWVSWVSGHGVGKSTAVAALALHFAATGPPGARVILTSSTAAQLREALWRELSRLHRTAKIPLGGSLAMLPSTGLRWADGRQIVGINADTPEAFAGIRAKNLMVIVDEASSEALDRIRDALFGNLSGGGKLLLCGNPTKSSGLFFESHKSARFTKLHTPSTASPNVVAGREIVPGLVTAQWIEDRKRDWGETGIMYRIRVLGEFVEVVEGRLFPPEVILASIERWKHTPATGRLVIGCDPAGPGSDGDASGFVGKRGNRVLFAETRMGLTPEAHVVELLAFIAAHKGDSYEPALIVVDRDGVVGAKTWSALHGHLQNHRTAFELKGIRGSELARRRPQEIDKMRDEIWFSLVDSFREGLAIPPGTTMLQADLSVIRFDRLVNGRARIIAKPQIRRELGGNRSPDLGDALALAAYEPIAARVEPSEEGAPVTDYHDQNRLWYAEDANDPWVGAGGGSPYWPGG